MKMNLRLKLRKTQSTIATEKLTEDLHSLEILSESVEQIPSLAHMSQCRYLLLVCPQLAALSQLPPNLEILKIKGGHFDLLEELPPLKTLSLQGLKKNLSSLKLPPTLETLDLANNNLEEIPASVYTLEKLSRLSLDHNQLKDLSPSLMAMKGLNHLSLDSNPLTEDDKQLLFDSFGIWF